MCDTKEAELELRKRLNKLRILTNGENEENTDLEATMLTRLLMRHSPPQEIPGSPLTDAGESTGGEPLVARVNKCYDSWKTLSNSRGKMTAIVQAMLPINILCKEVEDEMACRARGEHPQASAAYKLKCLSATKWDDVKSACSDIDNIVQQSNCLDKAAPIERLISLKEQAADLREHQQARKLAADELDKRVIGVWSKVREAAGEATRLQTSWSLLLDDWEKRVEKELAERGIDPV
eukprot:TRINITY_DN4455_c5_g1_i1.p1 TRINITY_DN4455_c5_g1~~TRINITY_DN4455_c5_g1_i1.p1  ORF type:complete len:252 (+),score=50.24 TRINITY_DN4455_c5_g1_i1:50-757(+)